MVGGSYDWNVGMEGHKLFRNDWQVRQEMGVALYVSVQLECMKLYLGMGEELAESLWIRIKGRGGRGDIITGICCRP